MSIQGGCRTNCDMLPFCVSYDFDAVSRIVDIGGVTEIVLEGVYAKRLHFASEMDILKIKEAIVMARTSNVFARVEPEIKEQAEQVLERLGIPMSNAVSMFLRQVVLQRGIPFEMKLPQAELLNYSSLTREQFDAEMEKGMADVKAGRVYSADTIEAEMRRDFGV